MTRSFTKQNAGLAAAVAMALAIFSGTANATDAAKDSAYATDSRGNVAMSAFGLCWHSGFGPAPVSTPECDPDFRPAVQPVVQLVKPAPAPVPVKVAAVPAAPPAAPLAAPPAPVPVAQRVTIDADTLFDFDKAVLRPAGRTALDAFAAKMKGIDPEIIMASGHTDRIGSERYNQRLSEERVGAVKDYLVSLGIAPNRMQTEGKGESQPVTKAGECVGGTSAKLIACLQPDRRVEIEVVGTQIAK